MGFFNQLFFGGKKCYRCGGTSTDFICNEHGLRNLRDDVRDLIEDRCWKPGRTECEVLYCTDCGHYIVDFPSTSYERGTQYYFTYRGNIRK